MQLKAIACNSKLFSSNTYSSILISVPPFRNRIRSYISSKYWKFEQRLYSCYFDYMISRHEFKQKWPF